jgi:Ras family protein A
MEQKIIDLSPSHKRKPSFSSNSTNAGNYAAYSPVPLPTKKLVIVGDGAAGKTSLLLAFARSYYSEEQYTSTVFDTFTVPVRLGGREACELSLWDTAGQEDYDRLRPLSYSDADVVLLAFALDHPPSLKNVLDKWAPEIRHFLPGVPMLLVGLKADKRGKAERAVSPQEAEEAQKKIGADAYVECSAKEGINVNEVFAQTLKTIGVKKRGTKFMGKITRAFSCLPLPFGPHIGSKHIVE